MINGHRVIAAEEHVATIDYLEATAGLAVWPGDETEMTLMRAVQAEDVMRDRLTDFGARLREMDASGTDLAVLSLNPPGVQPYNRAPATSLARDFNDVLAETVTRMPDRIAGLGTIAPQDPAWSAGEIERIMGPLRCSASRRPPGRRRADAVDRRRGTRVPGRIAAAAGIRPAATGRARELDDLGGRRLATMDAAGIDLQVLSVPNWLFLDLAPGQAGRRALLMDVAVLDPDGTRLPAGQPGEICARGPYVMAGTTTFRA